MVESFALDKDTIEKLVYDAVQKDILSAVETLGQDPAWLAKIESMINQAVVYQTMSRISSVDIASVIKERVDETMPVFHERLRAEFSSTGITDQATQTQLTVMDDTTVIENKLTVKDLDVATNAVVNNLIVTGSINTDNYSWDSLVNSIQEKTLTAFSEKFQEQLISDVVELIKKDGIDFSQVLLDGKVLAEGNTLSNNITETSIQKLGILKNLQVSGPAQLSGTVNVIKGRVGVNTEDPELALTVWDEEVAINVGKYKDQQAYIGTSRAQGITFGTNRTPHIEIDPEGLTKIKKLQIGLHKISHAAQVPGYLGTRGDIVFNTSLGEDLVFAWVCIGGYNWKELKSAE